MNKFLYFLTFLCFCFGCTENKQKLFVYTWSDYFDPELITKFESDNNCEVVIDTFDSNETALAKLLAGANSYDIITPTSYIIPIMVDNKIIKQLDHTKLQNIQKNFDKKYSNLLIDKEFKYSVPYAFSITGLMYQKNVVPENFDMSKVSYLCITNSFWQNRVCILNDIREIIGISLLENGYLVNSTNQNEIIKATKTAIILKNSSKKMDNEMYKNGIASGEIFIGMAYNSDAIQVMSETDTIGFTIPEKTTCSFDEFSISINSKNEDLAYKFIDYFYEQEIAAKNVEYIYTTMPIKEIENLISKDLPNRSLVLPSSEILSRCFLINAIDSNANALYNKAWDEIKATK